MGSRDYNICSSTWLFLIVRINFNRLSQSLYFDCICEEVNNCRDNAVFHKIKSLLSISTHVAVIYSYSDWFELRFYRNVFTYITFTLQGGIVGLLRLVKFFFLFNNFRMTAFVLKFHQFFDISSIWKIVFLEKVSSIIEIQVSIIFIDRDGKSQDC